MNWGAVKPNSKQRAGSNSPPGSDASPAKKEGDVTPDTMDLPLPLRERYRVEKKLGRGAFGIALLVVSKTTDEKSVAKVMNLRAMTPKDKKNVKNEIDCLSQCNHINIMRHIETYADESNLVLLTEYADGGDLAQEIKVRKTKNQPFSSADVACIFAQICLALDHIHQKGILHRDVKPANIFFTRRGLIKVGDFGFSKQYDETVSSEVGQTVLGTPYYLSPEMWLGERYSKKADMWAAGIVLFEMMALTRPFKSDTMKELCDAVRAGDVPPIPAGHFDGDLIKVCYMLLVVDPSARPEFREFLQLKVFQGALKSILAVLGHALFANCREAMTAHISSMLTD